MRRALPAIGRFAPELAAAAAERLMFTPQAFAAPDDERAALLDGHTSTLRVMCGTGPEAIKLWTFGATGPLVVLAHGWAGRGGQLHRLIAPLRAAGMRVLLFDAPAHGASTGTRVSLVDFVRTLLEIDRQLGPIAAVVGHSMGGLAAVQAVREGLNPAALVTIGAPAGAETARRRFVQLMQLSDEVGDRMARRVERRYGKTFAELELTYDVALTDLPALVVHDRLDRDVAFTESGRLAAVMPQAEVLATDGLGHRRVLRDAALLASVVDFVTREVERLRAELDRRAAGSRSFAEEVAMAWG